MASAIHFAVGLPVKYITCSLEGTTLALDVLHRLDQLPSLEWMKCILFHQCLYECGFARGDRTRE
jgi:hypothetical protein